MSLEFEAELVGSSVNLCAQPRLTKSFWFKARLADAMPQPATCATSLSLQASSHMPPRRHYPSFS